jgi:hypothetical protein
MYTNYDDQEIEMNTPTSSKHSLSNSSLVTPTSVVDLSFDSSEPASSWRTTALATDDNSMESPVGKVSRRILEASWRTPALATENDSVESPVRKGSRRMMEDTDEATPVSQISSKPVRMLSLGSKGLLPQESQDLVSESSLGSFNSADEELMADSGYHGYPASRLAEQKSVASIVIEEVTEGEKKSVSSNGTEEKADDEEERSVLSNATDEKSQGRKMSPASSGTDEQSRAKKLAREKSPSPDVDPRCSFQGTPEEEVFLDVNPPRMKFHEPITYTTKQPKAPKRSVSPVIPQRPNDYFPLASGSVHTEIESMVSMQSSVYTSTTKYSRNYNPLPGSSVQTEVQSLGSDDSSVCTPNDRSVRRGISSASSEVQEISSPDSTKSYETGSTKGTHESNETMVTRNTAPAVISRSVLQRPRGKGDIMSRDSFSEPFGSLGFSDIQLMATDESPETHEIPVEIKMRDKEDEKKPAMNSNIALDSSGSMDSLSLTGLKQVGDSGSVSESSSSFDVDSTSVVFTVDTYGNEKSYQGTEDDMIGELKARLAHHKRNLRGIRPEDLPSVVAMEDGDGSFLPGTNFEKHLLATSTRHAASTPIRYENPVEQSFVAIDPASLNFASQPAVWPPEYNLVSYNPARTIIAPYRTDLMVSHNTQDHLTKQAFIVDNHNQQFWLTGYQPPEYDLSNMPRMLDTNNMPIGGTTGKRSLATRTCIIVLVCICVIVIPSVVLIVIFGSKDGQPPAQTVPTASPFLRSPIAADVNTSPSTAPTESPTKRISLAPTFSDGGIATLLQMSITPGKTDVFDVSPSDAAKKALTWVIQETKDVDVLSDRTRLQQRFALVTVFFSTSGEQWGNNSGWLSNDHECNWFFTNSNPCDESGALTSLDLKFNSLVGVLPPQIGLLTHLKQIELGGNGLGLSGPIPSEIGALTKLQGLILTDNNFTGALPTELGLLTDLDALVFLKNRLEGTIPSALTNIVNLRIFYGSNNFLTGNIPPEIGNLSKLSELHLDENILTGSIPSTLGMLSDLVLLSIRGNTQVNGTLPSEISNLSSISFFDASSTSLHGTIPTELGLLQAEFSKFVLTSTQLTGSVPREVCDQTCCEKIPEFQLDDAVQPCPADTCLFFCFGVFDSLGGDALDTKTNTTDATTGNTTNKMLPTGPDFWT